MDEHEWLAEQFEANHTHLQAVAYRLLGDLSEADDAVQEAWLHLSRSDISSVRNLGGWDDHGRRADLPRYAARANRGASSPWKRLCLSQSRAVRAGPTLSTKRCWSTRSVWRCSSCSTRSLLPSASRSCCTTSSACPSTRLRASLP